MLLAVLTITSVLFIATGISAPTAQAQAVVPKLCFKKSSNTVTIGEVYPAPQDAGNPAGQAKMAITLPQLKDALQLVTDSSCKLPNGTSISDVIVDLGAGIWQLKASLIVSQSASLSVTLETVNELRLNSPLSNYPVSPSNPKDLTSTVKIETDGGQVLVQGSEAQRIKVYSWDEAANDFDRNPDNGRGYFYAQRGARMDILNAEIMFLGMEEGNPNFPDGPGKGERSGLAWRLLATPGNIQTGPRGNIINSLVHDNYFGMYSYEAVDMIVRGNKFYNSTFYGFDPHDRSFGFLVEDNEFFKNGKHGMIFSRGCYNNIIRNNKSYQNKEHGFMLDRDSNDNQMYNNQSYENGLDGIAIFQSSRNEIRDNLIRNNSRYGIRIDASWDENDSFDGLAVDNVVRNNTITGSGVHGLLVLERADRTTIDGNTVSNNGQVGMSIRVGQSQIKNNVISGNQLHAGILLNGAKGYATPVAVPPPARYVTPIDRPAHLITMTGNLLLDNNFDGIQAQQSDSITIGGEGSLNFIRGNGRYGIQITENSNTTVIKGNIVWRNGWSQNANGIFIKNSYLAKISQNNVSDNTGTSIKLTGSNGGILPPAPQTFVGTQINGTANPNATIEFFRDASREGEVYLGSTVADAIGVWQFTLPATDDPDVGDVTATQTDILGNTSQMVAILKTGLSGAAGAETTSGNEALEAAAMQQLLEMEQMAATGDMLEPDDAGQPLELGSEPSATPLNNRVFLPFASK